LAAVARARAELEVSRRVDVVFSADAGVPAVGGLLQPVLVLPMDATDWPDASLDVVALHEVAHVARWDGLSQLTAEIACAFYWPALPIWRLARHVSVLREQATDDEVLRTGVRASTYASGLIDLVRRCTVGELVAGPAMASPRDVEARIAAVLD